MIPGDKAEMTPKERRLRELEAAMQRLEQLHTAVGDSPAATVCHALREVCAMLAEELGEKKFLEGVPR